ncbi:purine catabolism regulator [Streptosporangium album]|uniref:Purine catabolism regulator n=1 Tax=Streptosporangium album TaxID=47479 RepID=A0A7W7RZI2_9ACTN|nr:PucR family transcriptional regulator [Streptosporangium album]MBB4941110.1 purine catabolism regulator [Streptosporangium album]
MPFHLADLVTIPELHLSVVAGSDRLDRPVEAAHTSELVRPGEWLRGGELLMTIGVLLPMDLASCRAYVRDVTDGGACGLALGLGHGLPYQHAPAPLVTAAEEAGLPLLTVPDEIPFIAVTKAVFAARAAEQRRELERAFETQRRLTTAAASGRGLSPILKAWTEATGLGVAVTDPLGRLIAAAGRGTADLLDSGTDLVQQVAARGMRGSGISIVGGTHAEVQPLGAQRLRGLLILNGSMAPTTRLLSSGLVSLLSLELERRHLAEEPERRRRSALLERLLDATSAGQARDVLGAAGLTADTVRGLVVEPASEAAEVAADLALAAPGGLARISAGAVELVVGGDLDVQELLDRFAPGCPAGIGSLVPPGSAVSSIRQARNLLEVSRLTGRPAEAQVSGSSRLLLGLGDRRALRGYADAVLGALDGADPAGNLVTTLATWLDTGGSWDETSRLLNVHRHTVRNRIDKAMRITGRRLDDANDRFDLWLATRSRQASRDATHSTG